MTVALCKCEVSKPRLSACIDFAREREIRRFGDRAYWKCDQQTVVSPRHMAFLYRVNLNRSNRNYKHVALLRYFLWFLVLCKNKDINVKQLSWSSLPCIFLTMEVLQGLGQKVAIIVKLWSRFSLKWVRIVVSRYDGSDDRRRNDGDGFLESPD